MAFNIKTIWIKYYKLWHELSGWKLFLFYTLHYTLLFVILQHCVFYDFYAINKSFIWKVDGISSYFPYLVYLKQIISDALKSFLDGNGFNLPLYEFHMGPVKTNLQYDPIWILSIFFSNEYLALLYDNLVLLEYYLTGLAFSCLGFYFHKKPLPIAIGAISYTFSGFAIYAGVRHPFFMQPMILLPLLIISAEMLLIDKYKWFFSIMVFCSIVTNLYFAYMMAILIVMYIAIRYFCVYKLEKKYNCGVLVIRTLFWGLLGIALSGFIMLPLIFEIFGSGRIGRSIEYGIFYSLSYYQQFLSCFLINPSAFLGEGCLGFSVLALPCIVLLFFNKNNRSLQIIFVLLTLMLCIPFVSYVMSGFNVLFNRWCFAYSLCISMIITITLPDILNIEKSKMFIVSVLALIYILICYVMVDKTYYHEEPVIFLSMLIILFMLCYLVGEQGKRFLLFICLIITCLSVCRTAYLKYAPVYGNYVSEFLDKDTAFKIMESGQYSSLALCEKVAFDETIFRVAGSNIQQTEVRFAFYYGLQGTSFYSFYFFPAYQNMMKMLEVSQRGTSGVNYGNDARAMLLSLNSVKYFVADGNNKATWPYGFKEIDRIQKANRTDVILENMYALPLGYTYDKYILLDDCMDAQSLDIQETMLGAVLLNIEPAEGFLYQTEFESKAMKIPIEIVNCNNVCIEDGILKVAENGATLDISFNGMPDMDTYLRIVNLDLTSGTSSRRWTLSVNTEDSVAYARFNAEGYLYDHGMKTQLIYLGNNNNGYNCCTIYFPQKGWFALDGLEIWCQPMNDYAKKLDALRAEVLENVEINSRGLTGTILTTKNKFLCFSIPYDDGWTAYVDGEKTELHQANIGYMGIELPAGHHDIELIYCLPGLKCGLVMTVFGVVTIIATIIYNKRKFYKI